MVSSAQPGESVSVNIENFKPVSELNREKLMGLMELYARELQRRGTISPDVDLSEITTSLFDSTFADDWELMLSYDDNGNPIASLGICKKQGILELPGVKVIQSAIRKSGLSTKELENSLGTMFKIDGYNYVEIGRFVVPDELRAVRGKIFLNGARKILERLLSFEQQDYKGFVVGSFTSTTCTKANSDGLSCVDPGLINLLSFIGILKNRGMRLEDVYSYMPGGLAILIAQALRKRYTILARKEAENDTVNLVKNVLKKRGQEGEVPFNIIFLEDLYDTQSQSVNWRLPHPYDYSIESLKRLIDFVRPSSRYPSQEDIERFIFTLGGNFPSGDRGNIPSFFALTLAKFSFG